MFSFFRKKPVVKPVFDWIGADMHNHLLPGIDDGSPDADTSLQLIEGLIKLGYNRFVCTPHVIMDVHPNTPETISKASEILTQAVTDRRIPVKLGYSAEYMVNFELDDLIKGRNLITFGNNQVLIEMSYAVESPNLRETIFALASRGYKPILAHPERYPYYHHRISYYEELCDMGCEMQVNMLSLEGYYGKPIRTVAEKLIGMGLISWLGTDMHHHRHLEALTALSTNKRVLNTIDKIKDLKNPYLL
jgi:tyrosine-protein phosphatase YwqE